MKKVLIINHGEYERLIAVAKTRREMLGISKGKMAERCDVTRQTIYNFENGLGTYNIGLAIKYLYILGEDAKEIKAIIENSLFIAVEKEN
jgi:DNA-binding XRE family transcriptional regulator